MTIKENLTKIDQYLAKCESEDIDIKDALASYSAALEIADNTIKELNTLSEEMVLIEKKYDTLVKTPISFTSDD